MSGHYPRPKWFELLTVQQRFWLRVWPRGDCWEWRGHVMRCGYGRLSFPEGWGTILAHRFAYIQAKGPIPHGLTIDHLCRHRWCVKPSHLEAVTNLENTLRGESPPARYARAVLCKRGHELVQQRLQRGCRICQRMSEAKSRAKKRAEAA